MTNLIGPDISFWQDDNATPKKTDFARMRTQTPFVILRAGQNVWVDTDFATNMPDAKAAGLIRGTYWFYDSRAEPKAQARKYIQTLGDDLGEMPLFADFEDSYGGPYGGWMNWYKFLEELKLLAGGHEVAIYTGFYYWKENTELIGIPKGSLDYFKPYKLWIANYGVKSPNVPPPWTPDEWFLWQYTDNGDGIRYGVESLNIDLNYFNGDLAEFTKLYGGVDIPTPPEEKPMPIALKASLNPQVTSASYLNIRALPDALSADLGDFKAGSVAIGDSLVKDGQGRDWFHVTSIDGAALVKTSYIAAWLCTVTSVTVEPTVPPVTTTPVVVHTLKINSIGQISIDGLPYE